MRTVPYMSANTNRRLQIVQQHLSRPTAPDPTQAFTTAAASDTYYGMSLRQLAQRVGGIDVLESLTTMALPDEPFDWSVVPPADRDRVAAVLEHVDTGCGEHLDIEARTIARRLLASVMRGDPGPIRRANKPERAAAAIVHAVLDGNRALGPGAVRIGRCWNLRAGEVAAWFGTSSVSGVARALVDAAELPPRVADFERSNDNRIQLNSVSLMHSKFRDRLIRQREHLVRTYLQHEEQQASQRKLVDTGDGNMSVRAIPAELALVQRGETDEGRSHVILGLIPAGEPSDLRVFAFSVPEARELQRLLDQALDGSATNPPRSARPVQRGPSFWPR